MIPTLDQLREEWGIKRYVEAMKIVSDWFTGHPMSIEELGNLKNSHPDAFDYFGSMVYHYE